MTLRSCSDAIAVVNFRFQAFERTPQASRRGTTRDEMG